VQWKDIQQCEEIFWGSKLIRELNNNVLQLAGVRYGIDPCKFFGF